MAPSARHLLLAAAVTGAVGVIATLLFGQGWRDALATGWTTSFPRGPWAWLLHITGAAVCLATVLSLLDILLSVRRQPRAPTFDGLGDGSTKEAIAEVKRRIATCVEGDRSDVVAVLDELLRGGMTVHASDIHINPVDAGASISYRVHGALIPVAMLGPRDSPRLVSRIKVLGQLDTYVHSSPQDGRLVRTLSEGLLEARVSTLPTEKGERAVLRLVRGAQAVPDLESLGYNADLVAGLKRILDKPQGLLLVTGPVGSGKTTTLYAALKYIAHKRTTTSLVTLEDPIELDLPFATQTQMHPRAGMTFAGTLRSALRQDPNVLMVGEIRDRETAEIAIQAGLSGHLILTTVHGDSAAGSFARLLDMGIEPFALASAVAGSASQRLVRTLCTACRSPSAPEPSVRQRFAALGVQVPGGGEYFEPVGCEFCENSGFTGRVPIAELLTVTTAVRTAITGRQTTEQIRDLARAEGTVGVLRDGLRRAQAGETSLVEVLRVAG